jgi:hypothetical protein
VLLREAIQRAPRASAMLPCCQHRTSGESMMVPLRSDRAGVPLRACVHRESCRYGPENETPGVGAGVGAQQ